MSLTEWVGIYLLGCLFNYWVLAMGGAKWLEGWKSFFAISWSALDWSAEQIRLYVLVIWIFQTIWFVVGLVNPSVRI